MAGESDVERVARESVFRELQNSTLTVLEIEATNAIIVIAGREVMIEVTAQDVTGWRDER